MAAFKQQRLDAARVAILEALDDGPVTHPSGLCLQAFVDKCAKRGSVEVDRGIYGFVLTELEREGLITRTIRGRRSFEIRRTTVDDDIPALIAAFEARAVEIRRGPAADSVTRAKTGKKRPSTKWSPVDAHKALVAARVSIDDQPVKMANTLQALWSTSRSTTFARIQKLKAWAAKNPEVVKRNLQGIAAPAVDTSTALDVEVRTQSGGVTPADAVAVPAATVDVSQSVPVVDVGPLAAELLRQVIDAATKPARAERDLHDVQGRLATTLEENERLRRKMREAEDLCKARAVEIEGLRLRIVNSETENRRLGERLAQAGNGVVLDVARERELRELARTMSEPPSPTKATGVVLK